MTPLPWARPRRLHEGHIAAAALGLVGASAAVPLDPWVHLGLLGPGPDRYLAPCLAATMGLLSAAVGWLSVRAESLHAVGRCLLLGMLGGWLSGALAPALATLLDGGLQAAAAVFCVCLFFGFVLGGLLGAFFGLVYTIPVWSASWHRHDPSHEGFDAALLAAGVWTLVLEAFLFALSASPLGWALSGAGAALSASAIAAAAYRRRARLQFLARVRAGDEPSFGVEPLGSDAPEGPLPLLERHDLRSSMLALVRHGGAGPGYRTQGQRDVVALIEERG